MARRDPLEEAASGCVYTVVSLAMIGFVAFVLLRSCQ